MWGLKKLVCLLVILAVLVCSNTALAVRMEADPNADTQPVDNQTALADGTYAPSTFSFSGGTGKVKITCPEVRVKNGEIFAVLHFSSSSYSYVKAAGNIYYAEIANGKSQFVIPFVLNANNRILAMTTKMSTPHEIEYTLFASLSPSAEEAVDALDDTAPEISGFTHSETLEADNLKIFLYDQNAFLFEIDTGLESTFLQEADLSDAENTAALYRKQVLKYFAVPENTEIPAGLEKQYLVIRTPISGICTASEKMATMLSVLGRNELICASMAENAGNYPYAGTIQEPSYKALLLNKVKLILADEEMLPALRDGMADRLANFGISAIVDCSKGADWTILYRLLLNAEA